MAIAANLRGNPVMSETLMMMKMPIVVATLIIPIFGWRRLWFYTNPDDDNVDRVIGVCVKMAISLLFVETQPSADNVG